jgi:hypothetical protein
MIWWSSVLIRLQREKLCKIQEYDRRKPADRDQCDSVCPKFTFLSRHHAGGNLCGDSHLGESLYAHRASRRTKAELRRWQYRARYSRAQRRCGSSLDRRNRFLRTPGIRELGDRRSVQRVGLWLFIVTGLIFLLSPVFALSDSNYSMLLGESMIRNHSTHLNAYRFPAPIREDVRCIPPFLAISLASQTFQLARVNGNVEYCYPHGTSILSIPFVGLMSTFGVNSSTADGQYNRAGEAIIQRLLASLLMAGYTVVLFRTALLLLEAMPSLLIAGGTALGTQVWSTASRVMWSHTWLIFLGGVVAYWLLRRETGQPKPGPIMLATLLSWMYFTRPTAAIPILCVTVYMFVYYGREFLAYSLTGLAWFGGFLAYSWFNFGKLIPDYYLHSEFDLRSFRTALPAILISPSRGLLIYVPVLIFVFYLLIRYWKTLPFQNLAILALAMVVTQILTIALWPVWWGGYSYGPRLLTDAVPWLALLAILGCAARLRSNETARFSRSETLAAFALLALSIAINARGAISWPTAHWHIVVDIDRHPDRAWDWSYPQFMAGLIAPPKY